MKHQTIVPADVPAHKRDQFIQGYSTITKNTGRLLLFSGDQKIEHLNKDFHGPSIDPSDNDPAHLFNIAQSSGAIGAFATHLGLIARYGPEYPEIAYIIKLNGKTPLVTTEQQDPLSLELWSVDDVVSFKESSGLNVVGVGYTLYLGSEFEAQMLHQAAQIVYGAHQAGLIAMLWVYPRGHAVPDERDGKVIAGAAGVAASLGADFVKLNQPDSDGSISAMQALALAAQAAGNTKIICSGGPRVPVEQFLHQLHAQIHQGNAAGTATGRNIHQLPLAQANALTKAMAAIVYDNQSVAYALNLVKDIA
jgi:fructose-bisphosphate aldolase/6-deoxy-5-ketofructose 1-phosphate synthase